MYLKIGSILETNDDIWLTLYDCPFLLRYNENDNKVYYFTEYIEETLFNQVGGMIEYKNKIIVFPAEGHSVIIVNRKTKEKEYLRIENSLLFKDKFETKFLSAYIREDCLYLVGVSIPLILKINLITKEQHFYEYFHENDNLNQKVKIFSRISRRIDDIIYIPCCLQKCVSLYNMVTSEVQQISIPGSNEGFVDVCDYEDSLLFLSYGNEGITITNKQFDDFKLVQFPVEMQEKERCFSQMWRMGDDIYLIPYEGNGIFRYAIRKEKFERLFIAGKYRILSSCMDKRLLFASDKNNVFVITKGKVYNELLDIDDFVYKKIINAILKRNGFLLENECNDLQLLLNYSSSLTE